MKKLLIAVLGIVGMLCLSASPLLAGAVINKSNLSADYFRSLSRHASEDAADIIAFNPAGVMEMENGFYTKLDILYIKKDYSNVVPGSGSLESDIPSIVPGLFILHKKEKWAGFFAVTVPGGGGEVEYDQGNARTAILGAGVLLNPAFSQIDSQSLKGDSFAVGYTVGGAYKVNNLLSLAGGLRYIDSQQEFDGDLVVSNPGPSTRLRVDLEREATGWGYFLGANVSPTAELNIGLLYQSNTDLDYKSKVENDDIGVTPLLGWANGTKQREDLPGLIGLGVGYQVIPKLRAEVAYTRYLEGAAKFESTRFNGVGDSWEVGVSLTYEFSPEWRASVGYLHTDIKGMESFELLAEAPELDAQTIGIGAVYSPSASWQFSFGYTHVEYDEVTTDSRSVTAQRAPAGTEFDKEVGALSFGVQYRWF